MDWTVYPNTPISRLPALLRYPALLLRNLLELPRRLRSPIGPDPLKHPVYDYVYEADGIATIHYCPFLSDTAWSEAYEETAREWYPGKPGMDVRWRMWILTSLAEQARSLAGSFAEFGVYRAGCARMILTTAGLDPATRYFLFDTFEGIPESELTEGEIDEGLAGRLRDTSVSYVEQRLAPWRDQLVFCAGDVFETLPRTETGDLSFVHMDLNASAPTRVALEYAYERLLPGGIVVFDDYGASEYADQRHVIDDVCAPLPESVLALPSGQGALIKLG